MTEKKIYITEDDKANFLCPGCGKAKTKDVSKYKNVRTLLRVKYKCACGHAYSVLIERRKYFRKEVNLTGGFVYGENKGIVPMVIRDMSRTGLRIEIGDPDGVNLGDMLFAEFNLDDKPNTLIREEVVVKSIDDGILHLEFTSLEPGSHFDNAIRLYMFKP